MIDLFDYQFKFHFCNCMKVCSLAVYDKKRLHGKKYFGALLERVEDVPDSVKELLKLSRNSFEMFDALE